MLIKKGNLQLMVVSVLFLLMLFPAKSAQSYDVFLPIYHVGKSSSLCPGAQVSGNFYNSGGSTVILDVPNNFLQVIMTRACFDDNGYIVVNGTEVFRNSGACCSAGCHPLQIDITNLVLPGGNAVYGYADDCCGYCAEANATFSIETCADNDNDGIYVCMGDCDDTDASIYPGAPEVCDGKDNNCNGEIDR